MALSKTYKDISLASFVCYCDICFTSASGPQLFEAMPLSITKSKVDQRERHGLGNGDPYSTVPPVQQEAYQRELEQRGWRFETVHGKLFAVCPNCAELPNSTNEA